MKKWCILKHISLIKFHFVDWLQKLGNRKGNQDYNFWWVAGIQSFCHLWVCGVKDIINLFSFQRDMRDGFRRKSFHASHYVRDRSPHKRETPFLRESPVGRKDSPHSRSGSSVSSRSYSPERSKTYSFHQSQHRSMYLKNFSFFFHIDEKVLRQIAL